MMSSAALVYALTPRLSLTGGDFKEDELVVKLGRALPRNLSGR